MELDDGHGEGDGHKRDDQSASHLEMKKEKKMGSRQTYNNRSHFWFALKTP